MKFTIFYARNSVCSPSRAVFIAGKSSSIDTIPGNNGLMTDGSWDKALLRKDEVTLGERMTDAGYEIAFIGKWHLGDTNHLLMGTGKRI